MEQKLHFNAVAALLRGPSHPRALAKELGVNHMAAVRALKALVAENVVDHRTDGRNKVYFLKGTIEARNYTIMAELHRLNVAVARYPILRKIASDIHAHSGVQMALLFGSYAKGYPTKDSDIDIYVETEDLALRDYLRRLNSRLSVKIGRYDRKNLLIREIEKDHIVIKGAEAYYEKTHVPQ